MIGFYRRGTFTTPRHSRTNSIAKHLAHHHHDNMLKVIERNYENNHVHYIDDTPVVEPIKKKRNAFLRQLSTISTSSIFSVTTVKEALTESKELIIHISPVDIIEWSEYPWYKKTMECIKAIPYFFMTLCIPVVDLESPKNNWCRLLTCLNVIFAPQVALFFLGCETNTKPNKQFNIKHTLPLSYEPKNLRTLSGLVSDTHYKCNGFDVNLFHIKSRRAAHL